MNADRERPVDVADAMSVGGDDGDEGDDGRERQQTSDVAVGDGVEQDRDDDVDEPRHRHRPAP